MAKFDPDKNRKDAEASIVNAEAKIEKIRKGLPAAQESLKRAQGRVAKIEEKVAEEQAHVSRLHTYLDATANLENLNAPQGTPGVPQADEDPATPVVQF